jgi:hypothetical protein
MPLPPLPDNNTDRYWLKYKNAGIEHEICFRLASSTTTANGIATAQAIAAALDNYTDTTGGFTALRKSQTGSDLSFPVAWTSVPGTNSTAYESDDKVSFVALSGRSAGGYRCRITFFTPFTLDDDGFRLSTTSGLAGQALYDAVTALSPVLVAKDGLGVIWNAYVNTGWNSYWQRRSR